MRASSWRKNLASEIYLAFQIIAFVILACLVQRLLVLAIPLSCAGISLLVSPTIQSQYSGLDRRGGKEDGKNNRSTRVGLEGARESYSVLSEKIFKRTGRSTSRLPPNTLNYIITLSVLALTFSMPPDRLVVKNTGYSPDEAKADLVEWINNTTDTKSSFTSDMTTTSVVWVGSRRPITLHPHFEYQDLRRYDYIL